MKKVLRISLPLIVLLIAIYFMGPKATPYVASAAIDEGLLQEVGERENAETWVKQVESDKKIRQGNESQFYWADSVNKKTEYVLLYLHGFSASPEEGAPTHLDFAKRYGMNLYAPLLAEHGLIEAEPMLNFTAEAWINSAKEALAMAALMGDKVIIMGTSTGGTSALFLASEPANRVHGVITYSPNIRVFDKRASILTGPWGLQLSKLVKGSNYNRWEAPAGAEQYWHLKYRLEAVVEMQRLLEATMNEETFAKITAPTFLGYYYKNEDQQDNVVSVAALEQMFEQLGSEKKYKVALPEVGAHALSSKYFSQDLESVRKETYKFAEEVLGLKPR
jgi:esterase/lipase